MKMAKILPFMNIYIYLYIFSYKLSVLYTYSVLFIKTNKNFHILDVVKKIYVGTMYSLFSVYYTHINYYEPPFLLSKESSILFTTKHKTNNFLSTQSCSINNGLLHIFHFKFNGT